MLLAMVTFSVNDALGKWLVATYSVAQILFIRSIGASLMLAPFMLKSGLKPFREAPRPGLQVVRALLATAETASFYLAVWYIPLATAMTFYLAGPIYVTALSAIFLREKVGLYRWSAVLVGFAGVIVALKPSAETLGPGSLIALGGSFLYALMMIATRQLRETSNVVLAGTQVAGAITLGAIGLPFAWTAIAGVDFLLLLLLGVVAIFAIVLVNQSLRLAPASIVAPYQYSLIVWAVLFGYLFFGDVPKPHTLIGAGIIVASGLFILVREQRLKVASADEVELAER